jgi:hypothetical protein
MGMGDDIEAKASACGNGSAAISPLHALEVRPLFFFQ